MIGERIPDREVVVDCDQVVDPSLLDRLLHEVDLVLEGEAPQSRGAEWLGVEPLGRAGERRAHRFASGTSIVNGRIVASPAGLSTMTAMWPSLCGDGGVTPHSLLL